jgi:LysR family glycine cleavage system transcriptional activator
MFAVNYKDGRTAYPADLSPVCSPRLADGLREPRDLAKATLLGVAHADEDWRVWLDAAGVRRLTPHGPVFDYYGQVCRRRPMAWVSQ